MKDFKLSQDEHYSDFIHRTLCGIADDATQDLHLFILELVLTEMKDSAYTVSISIDDKDIALNINHQGKAVKDNIISIIDDQVDYLLYQHHTKNNHTLRIRKHKNNA